MNKNIIILSSKSSGSTALQDYFIKNAGFNSADFTEHQEGETLFWTKVASILKMEQDAMVKSIIPYTSELAKDSLQLFLNENLGRNISIDQSTNYSELYYELIQKNLLFIEKSPHHLFNWSNLELIAAFYKMYANEIDIKIIGLVRHPYDVIYSAWQRWGYDCQAFEKEWRISYENLLNMKSVIPINVMRYEDLINKSVSPIEMLGLERKGNDFHFRKGSVKKWKHDLSFGFKLDQKTIELAQEFGYEDFDNPFNSLKWKFKSKLVRLKKIASKVYRKLKK